MGSKKKNATKQHDKSKGPANGHQQRSSSSSQPQRDTTPSPKAKSKQGKSPRTKKGSPPPPSSSQPQSRLPWRLVLLLSILAGGVGVLWINETSRSVIGDVYITHIQPQVLRASESVSEGIAAVRHMIQGPPAAPADRHSADRHSPAEDRPEHDQSQDTAPPVKSSAGDSQGRESPQQTTSPPATTTTRTASSSPSPPDSDPVPPSSTDGQKRDAPASITTTTARPTTTTTSASTAEKDTEKQKAEQTKTKPSTDSKETAGKQPSQGSEAGKQPSQGSAEAGRRDSADARSDSRTKRETGKTLAEDPKPTAPADKQQKTKPPVRSASEPRQASQGEKPAPQKDSTEKPAPQKGSTEKPAPQKDSTEKPAPQKDSTEKPAPQKDSTEDTKKEAGKKSDESSSKLKPEKKDQSKDKPQTTSADKAEDKTKRQGKVDTDSKREPKESIPQPPAQASKLQESEPTGQNREEPKLDKNKPEGKPGSEKDSSQKDQPRDNAVPADLPAEDGKRTEDVPREPVVEQIKVTTKPQAEKDTPSGDKSQTKSTAQKTEKTPGEEAGKSTEKSGQKPADPKPTAKPDQKPAEQKPADPKPTAKPDQKPAEQKPADPKTTAKPDQKPTEQKPADPKTTAKPEQKPTEQKPTEQKPADPKTTAKPDQKPTEQKPTEQKSADPKTTAKPDQKPVDQPDQKPTTKPDTKPPANKADQRPADKADQRPADKADQRPADMADQRPADMTAQKLQADKADQKPADKADQKPQAEDQKPAPETAEKADKPEGAATSDKKPEENQTTQKAADIVKENSVKRPQDTYAKAAITNDADYKIREKLDEADNLLAKGKLESALQMYDGILRKHPNSPRAQLGRADTLDGLAEKKRSNELLEQCIDAYQRLLTSQADLKPELFKMAGRRLSKKQQFRGWGTKAVKTYQLLTERFPDDLDLQKERGVSHLLVRQDNEARAVFQNVLRQNPTDGFSQVHLGFILKVVDDNPKAAVPLLQAGIDSGEEGTQDGRFFFHLGDALQRLGQPDKARTVYQRGADIGLFLSADQRSLYNVDTLTGRPWWTPEQTGYQKYLKLLEDNWRTIREEGLRQLDSKTGSFTPEAENLREKGDWKQLTLYQQGRQNSKTCQLVPKTCALIEQIPDAKGCRRGQVKYSVMRPGVHVWPHCGPTNCRLRAHLGLVVPDGPRIRVANETRTWTEGKFIIFDDSFEHEVWHEGDSVRLVLIVDFWHPEVTSAQKRSLPPI